MLLLFILLLLTRFTAKYMVNTTKLLLSKEIQILPNVNTRLFMPFMKTRLKLRTKSTLTGNVFQYTMSSHYLVMCLHVNNKNWQNVHYYEIALAYSNFRPLGIYLHRTTTASFGQEYICQMRKYVFCTSHSLCYNMTNMASGFHRTKYFSLRYHAIYLNYFFLHCNTFLM